MDKQRQNKTKKDMSNINQLNNPLKKNNIYLNLKQKIDLKIDSIKKPINNQEVVKRLTNDFLFE